MSATKTYLAPQKLDDALRAASESGAVILAGGTDLQPRWSKETRPRPRSLVDVKRIESLRGTVLSDGWVQIGACTLMAELQSDPIVRESAPILAEAAGRVACPQVRNRATIGGNLCNASPAADSAVPLLLLDAVLDLASCTGGEVKHREVAMPDFFKGPGVTCLDPGEILAHIRFKPLPSNSPDSYCAWKKFGTRPAMEIAVASVGVVLAVASGKIQCARVGYGSVAPVPMRGHKAEAALLGQALTEDTIETCVAAAREEISPISDARAGESYRRTIVGVMLKRMLEHAKGS